MNVTCPVNFTSYGLCGLNVLRALDRAGSPPAWWPIGDTQAHQADVDFLADAKARQARYDQNATSLRLYHDFDLAQHVGRGKKVSYTIFELDRFTPRSLHQLRCQDAVAVPSRWAASVLPDGVEKHVVPLGIDRSIFFPRPMPGPGPTTFLTVGKWERRKGHDALLQAFERAFEPSDDVRLVLACANHSVPGGPERMAAYNRGWEDYYMTSRLAAKVTLVPRLGTQAELAALMASADCGVFLSRAEGWNLGLSEVLAMGRPVIATFVTAHTEYLTESNALLVHCPDTEEAHDGVWFDGQGRWASLGDGEIDQAAGHMRKVHEDKRRGDLAANARGALDMERYTWEMTARGLLAC